MKAANISIVVPVFNEAESLDELIQRLEEVASKHDYQMQILLVDDGSTDGSWGKIESLSKANSSESLSIEGIRFRRNFGKAAALSAGFEAARGDIIITMDADLQDDPSEIPNLLSELQSGLDVVSGWKKLRHDPWHKVIPSRCFNGMVSWLTGVRLHDHNCGLKGYRSDVLREIRIYGELHRFIPVLAAARGWRVGETVVQHHPRKHGSSKYGFRRFFKGFLDLLTVYFLTGFQQRPQHLMGTIGLLCLGFGSLGIAILTVAWGLSRVFEGWPDVHLHERAIFYYALVSLLLGVQLISMGFLAELITASQRSSDTSYSISNRCNSKDNIES